jgi:hypothetical protein
MNVWCRRSLVAMAILALSGGVGTSVRAQEERPAPTAGKPAGFAVSDAASDLPAAQPEPDKDSKSFRRNTEGEDAEEIREATGVAPDQDGAPGSALTSAPDPVFGGGVISSFDGLSNFDNAAAFGFQVSPPDTNMDVGPHRSPRRSR